MDPLKIPLDQRPVPAAALRDSDSHELLRVWIAEKGLHCSLVLADGEGGARGSQEDAWGVVLAYTARQLAHALQRGNDQSQLSMARIRAAFIDELGSLDPSGEVESQTRH